LMKGGGRTDSKLSYSIDYEIEKKTALMFAWCVILTLEAFRSTSESSRKNEIVGGGVGGGGRKDNWNEIFRKLAWRGDSSLLESGAGQFNCLALRREWIQIEMGFGWGTGVGVCRKPHEIAVRIKCLRTTTESFLRYNHPRTKNLPIIEIILQWGPYR
jgi:hypothetical protein